MINVLERISYLRNLRGWTEYQLAEESGLTQSTISSWYRKNMIPSITSLEKICLAFGITLSQFFAEENENYHDLTQIQKNIVAETSHLTEKQQFALIEFIKTL